MTTAIVAATPELVAEIEEWLDVEEAAYQKAKAAWEANHYEGDIPPRGFRCNWDTAKRVWTEGRSKLDVMLVDGKAVGFLSDYDILEIHPDYRGRGLGMLFSDFMLRRAREEGYSVLGIEIAPASAEPFWVGQGFVLDDDKIHFRNGLYAHMILERKFDLGNGPRVPVLIEFYDEQTIRRDVPPFVTFEGEGERLIDGSIQLPERVHGFNPNLRNNGENHIRIVVDGEDIYFGRSKYEQQYGQTKDPVGNHYIDRIVP